VIPGCRSLDVVGPHSYRAEVDMGVGPVRGRFQAHVRLFDLDEPHRASLSGEVIGPLGSGSGSGTVTLEPVAEGTLVTYTYEVKAAGKVAAVGGRMLDGAARALIRQFFNGLVHQAGGGSAPANWWIRIKQILGLAK
jgi:2-furoyl-CoA dehydrogenase large subunit